MPLRQRIREIALTHARYGYRRVHIVLEREGWKVNVKRVQRLYCLEGLQMRLKPPRRRVMAKLRSDRSDATGPSQVWAMDWMYDELFDGRRIWVLTVIDTWSRVCPTLDFSRPGKPTDNAFAESFNASVRLECLGQHWFLDLDDARKKVEDWRRFYNEARPHSAIGDRTPITMIQGLPQSSEASQTPENLT